MMNGGERNGPIIGDSLRSDLFSHLMHLGSRCHDKGETELNPLLVIGWLFFKEELDYDVVVKNIMDKLVKKVFRYRTVPCERNGYTYWDELPLENLDMEYHFGKRHGGSYTSQQEWKTYLDELVKRGLDHDKPWWRFELVKKFPCGRSGLIMIVNHAFADGASMVTSLHAMCDKNAEISNPVMRKQSSYVMKSRPMTFFEIIHAHWLGIFRPLCEAVMKGDRVTKLKTISPPQHWDFSLTSHGESMDIQKFKDIKNHVPGCTVNDVMLALTALSIKRYYEEIEEPIMKAKDDITATYAVNCRPPGVEYLSDEWFGNHIVVATTTYPLHDSRIATLLKFRDCARYRKMSLDTQVRYFMVHNVTKLEKFMERKKFLDQAADMNLRFSIMISNVLVSLNKLHVFGKELDDVQFIATSPQGCYCGVATYAGKVNCNIVTARECNADPDRIVDYYRDELDKLHQEVLDLDEEIVNRLDKPPQSTGIILFGMISMTMVLTWIYIKR